VTASLPFVVCARNRNSESKKKKKKSCPTCPKKKKVLYFFLTPKSCPPLSPTPVPPQLSVSNLMHAGLLGQMTTPSPSFPSSAWHPIHITFASKTPGFRNPHCPECPLSPASMATSNCPGPLMSETTGIETIDESCAVEVPKMNSLSVPKFRGLVSLLVSA
jgi:hypothetical protein